ncbi:conserved hypothetical protein [Leishmania infantum JPCM5]|uniref:PH-like domain-containing protein n=2 Tax=Leishmania infantum TaxID=5671 RepID=A4HT74_LEIIN|nr:conserved hypothetical protein [Leishmania infantum JPCM5]CAM65621.1 conserved hypothetical protein [Leishmania infantum JPCM5]|eukprot:XP_001463265.1 conserved hypothetical protein [Leishmania infantum JPCM5]
MLTLHRSTPPLPPFPANPSSSPPLSLVHRCALWSSCCSTTPKAAPPRTSTRLCEWVRAHHRGGCRSVSLSIGTHPHTHRLVSGETHTHATPYIDSPKAPCAVLHCTALCVMPVAADASVSDSIAYLQDFVNQSGRPTRKALPQDAVDAIRPALRGPSTAERGSPPNISMLNNRGNNAPLLGARGSFRRDSVGEDRHTNLGAGDTYSSIRHLGNSKPSHSASDSRNDGILNGTSLLQRPRASATLASVGHSPYIREAASASGNRADPSYLPSFINDSNASRGAASAAPAATSSGTMFRYGKDSAAPPSLSTRRKSYTYTGGAVGGGWAASAPPSVPRWEWSRASSFSSTPPYGRVSTAATTTTPASRGWRHSSAPPPPVSRRGPSPSSLLWGWGDSSGEETHRGAATASTDAATAASPSPYEPRGRRDKHVWEEGSVRDSYVNSAYASRPVSSVLSASHSPPAAPAARRDSAYEEVREDQSSQSWRQPLRRPPLAPSPPCATSTTTPPTVSADRVLHHVEPVEFVSCHNADEHAANVRRIAHYLKNYYAREAGEMERGVESLSAEDVAGLAQCFYIDLYRTVRQARREAGMETSSFLVEDPTENVIASVAPVPPPPPQRERHDSYTPPPQRPTTSDARNRLVNSSATSDTEPTYRAPNAQLAFSGGGTHPVQIITARLPAFRNDDITTAGDGTSALSHLRPSVASSVSPAASSTASASRAHEEARARVSPAGPAAVGSSALPYDLDNENAEAVSSLAQAATPSPPYRHLHRAVDTAGAAPPCATVQHHQSSSFQPHMVFGVSQHHPFSAPNGFAAAPAEPSSSPRLNHRQGDTNSRGQHNRHGRQDASLHTRGRHVHMRDGYVDSSSSSSSGEGGDHGSETGRCDGRRDTGGGAGRAKLAASQPSSGIVKRPLKDLMPLLRSRGTLAVKYIHNSRRPHLRLFQILDCMDTYCGSEVLMPHFTWATPADAHRHDRLPRAKRSKHGAPLPTGLSLSQQEVPYETALNLVHLEAVYVGAGHGIAEAHMTLFRRAKCGANSRGSDSRVDGGAVVVDHGGRPVANDMCAVFVFASRPVAVSFLREDDRQAWVGAMMGVVERNRTLTA